MSGSPSVWAFAPGLFLIGLGIGAMLTPSVNVVQSSFGEEHAGRDLRPVAQRVQPRLLPRRRDRRHDPRRRPHVNPERSYALAMVVLAVIGVVGLVASVFLPARPCSTERPATTGWDAREHGRCPPVARAQQQHMRVLVIGGGPAEDHAALQASELGANVMLVEARRLGGTSLNEGPGPIRTPVLAGGVARDDGE